MLHIDTTSIALRIPIATWFAGPILNAVSAISAVAFADRSPQSRKKRLSNQHPEHAIRKRCSSVCFYTNSRAWLQTHIAICVYSCINGIVRLPFSCMHNSYMRTFLHSIIDSFARFLIHVFIVPCIIAHSNKQPFSSALLVINLCVIRYHSLLFHHVSNHTIYA